MSARARLVVSAENNAYTGWQSQVLVHSASKHLGTAPLVVCHGGRRGLHRYFEELRAHEAEVLLAPNYRDALGVDYAPANTAGTLLEAARALKGKADFLVLLDPDMIFVRPVTFPGRLSGHRYDYMSYRSRRVRAAAKLYGVSRRRLEEHERALSIGVPYVIPIAIAKKLGEEWLKAMEAFVAGWGSTRGGSSRWCEIMHAFGLAATKLELVPQVLDVNDVNAFDGTKATRPIVHYCYGADGWSKRAFVLEERDVWRSPAGERGTVTGEVLAAIAEAAEVFGHARG